MFKIINLFKDVSTTIFSVDNSIVYNSYKNYDVLLNGKIVFYKSSGFVYYENNLFVGDWSGNLLISLGCENEFSNILNGYSMGAHIFGDKFIVLSKINSSDNKYLFNLETQEIIKEIKKLDYWLNLEECINVDHEGGRYVITKDNLDSHKVVWSFDLRVLTKFNFMGQDSFDSCLKIIGNTLDELWVATNANRLLVLDLNTGKLVHLFELDFVNSARSANLVNDKIIIYRGILTVIDIKNKEIIIQKTQIDLGEEFTDFDVEDVSEIQGDYITFNATKKGSQYIKTIIGIFDFVNQSLVWLHEFPLSEKISMSTRAPELSGSRLYALDASHRLYIFEKEINV